VPVVSPAAGTAAPPTAVVPAASPVPGTTAPSPGPEPVPPRRRSGARLAGVALLAVVAGGASGLVADQLPGLGGSDTFGAAEVPGAGPSARGAEAAARTILPSVVQVRASRGSGSGFVLDDRGHVVTNHHVVEGATDVQLQLSNGRLVDAEVVGSDPAQDVAVLRTTARGLSPASLGSSSVLRIGEQVLAIGSPLGLSGTVTSGIVSATQRRADIGDRGAQDVIQTDASINPGNSGGPLVDLRGRVVGVNTAIATTGASSGNIGIGFAVPIDRAAEVARRLIQQG
jgi:putative serine protease PepD